MKRRLTMGALALVALFTFLTVYVIARVGPQIGDAKEILSANVTNLTKADLQEAERHLTVAHGVLHSFAANILRVLPIERQNLDTVRNGVDHILPVLADASALRAKLRAVQQSGLVQSSHVSLPAIEGLRASLGRAGDSVGALVKTLRQESSGWLLPSINRGVEDTLRRAEQLQRTTKNGSDMVATAPRLLGAEGRRRYLVLLVNNAEVRPSGGIVSGIGLVTVKRGHFQLGPFHYYTDLAQRPYKRVPAPPDFRRRYRRFNADTTRWVNVTLSPNTEEVATVAARLYQATAGKRTDGAIIADPQGIASLLPSDARVQVPGTHRHLTPRGLPRYVYSNAYRELGGHTTARHDALIAIGQSAFHTVTTTSFGSRHELDAAGSAIAGGHLRLISFKPDEEDVLRRVGVTGSLRSPAEDRVFITDTNFNGTKLDFWSHKNISHTCDIRPESLTLCETAIAIENNVRSGLSRYVAGDHPYGQIQSLVEVYLPRDAIVQRVFRDGQPVTFDRNPQDGMTSIGVEARVAPGETGRVVVDYALPQSGDGYTLQVASPPLTHDANLRVTLRIPSGWNVSHDAQGELSGNVYNQTSKLGRPQTVSAGPYRLRGISSVWEKLVNFWNNPVF